MKQFFGEIRKKGQGNKFVKEDILHIITRTNRAECGAVCQNDRLSAGHIWQTRSHVYGEVKCQAEVQSDVVIPNKLDNGETCRGLLRRFVHKNTNNNEISPHNDMIIKNVTNLFPYFPISLSLKKKLAFTLAEVLITLGVIGIVAAMTIPNLIQNNYEKKVVAQLRETQSILSQAVRMAEEEHGDASGWGLSGSMNSSDAKIIAEKITPYLKLATDCGVENRDFVCVPNTNYKFLDGTGATANYGQNSAYYKVKLMNGVSVWWRGADATEIAMNEYIDFFVDVNNSSLPNTLGKDLFLFIYENYSIKAEGAPQTQSANSCGLNTRGWGCAYYVLQNQNMNYLHKKH